MALLVSAACGTGVLTRAPAAYAASAAQSATLTRALTAYRRPDATTAVVAQVAAVRPITGGATVLPVLAVAPGTHAGRWLHVLLPGRPNGTSGWIPAATTVRRPVPWSLAVDLSGRKVQVRRGSRLLRSFSVVIGKASTPTPVGRFFVEETVALRPQDVGAPYALALSARSEVLQEFAGGPGQIALHGTDNVGGKPGTAASHGCIRLSTKAVTWLGERIGPGVRVTIRA